MSRLSLVVVASDLETNGFAQHFLEWCDVPMRRPQLQFRVPVRTQAGQIVIPAREQIQSAERLRVAAIKALGQTDHCPQRPHGLPQRPAKVGEPFV